MYSSSLSFAPAQQQQQQQNQCEHADDSPSVARSSHVDCVRVRCGPHRLEEGGDEVTVEFELEEPELELELAEDGVGQVEEVGLDE